jgi:putative DNA-invertase from lambdoid prophage Rac
MQLTALRQYVEPRGWNLCQEYVDKASRNLESADLPWIMADARRRAFGAVVVFRFDRFARWVSHLARALDEFRALVIEFVSLHEAVDTSTAMGRAMFDIAGAFAELERAMFRERVKAGLANARRRGRNVGATTGHGQHLLRMREMASQGSLAVLSPKLSVSRRRRYAERCALAASRRRWTPPLASLVAWKATVRSFIR